jgi:hypothetical protein
VEDSEEGPEDHERIMYDLPPRPKTSGSIIYIGRFSMQLVRDHLGIAGVSRNWAVVIHVLRGRWYKRPCVSRVTVRRWQQL